MAKSRQYRTIETDLMGYPVAKAGINSKKKGDKNEREACKWLLKWTGEKFTRVPSSGGLRWKNNPTVCGDVVCENHLFNFIFSVETKHLNKIFTTTKLRSTSHIFTIWKQALTDSVRSGKIPMLMLRSNGMGLGEYIIVFNQETAAKLAPEISVAYEFFGVDKSGEYHLFGYSSAYVLDKIPYQKFVL